jgi:hypothetical protein
MNTYSIKVDTQNLSKSFIYYENDKLSYEAAKQKLDNALLKNSEYIKQGIEPVVYDNRNRAIKVRKMYLVKND